MKNGCLPWIVFVGVIIAFFVYTSYDESQTKETMKAFDRIFMDSPGNYTVLAQNGNEAMSVRYSPINSAIARIFTDVPLKQRPWLRATVRQKWPEVYESLEIHIHSIKEIEGGTRSLGKFGNVPVKEIE